MAAFGLFLFLIAGFQQVLAQNPVADFTLSAAQGCVPLNVQFTNTSQNAVSHQWSFGNGNSSTQVNPSNVFTAAGTYTVSLTVTSASGNTSTHATQVLVHPKPQADFSVAQTSGCQGAQVFSFQNLSSLYDSCVWDFGDGTTSNANNPQHVYNLPGTFHVTLVVYNSLYGCSDMKVRSNLLTVYPSPGAIISVNDTATCDPQYTFQLNAVMSNAVTWTWQFGDGTGSALVNPSHVYGDTGVFQPFLVMTSSNGCIDTTLSPFPVHVKWNPVPPVTVSDDSGCMPHYLAMITTHYSNANYSWNLGNGLTRSGSAVYYTYPDSGSFPVTLSVNYTNGCSQVVSAGPVKVYPRPFFSYWMNNFTGCAPLPVQFINSTAAAYTWLWDFGDGSTSTQQAPVHIYSSPGSYQVSLTATTVNGCVFGFPLNQKVNVFSPNAAFQPDVTSGCPPLLVNFNNQSSGAVSYQWSFGDGTSSTQAHPTHTYTTPGLYQVTLIATDATGCADTMIYPTAINVSQSPVNYITPPVITACAPYAVNFSDASGATSFLWDFGDGTTSTLSNPYHIYTEPGTYTVSLTTWMPNGGCEQYISDFQTFVIDGAEPGFTYTVSPCPPYEVFFTDTSLNAAGWSWNFGDGGSDATQHPSHVYPGPGSYNVTLSVTTPAGCTTTLHAANGVIISGLGANASAVCTDTVPPFNVQYYANSTGATWWTWSFGDGDSSSLEDPQHTYLSAGPFQVSLTIGNDSCQFTYDYPPISFGSSVGSGGGLGGGGYTPPPREYHCAPYTVNFANPDPTALAFHWDFGDGDSSSLDAPEHIYRDSGAFVVTLYLYNMFGGIDTITYSDTIFVVKPVSDFNISTTNLCNGVVVDVATAAPGLTFDWDFGNGISFATPTASHTYPNVNASYMISLNVTDTNHCNSFVAKSFAVNASSPLTASTRRACAGDSIKFDPGNVNYNQYLWTFGDGNNSTLKNPWHAYQDSGLYTATLLVTDLNGCQLTFTMTYSIEVFDPVADFTFTPPVTNCTTLYVTFNNLSAGSNSWFWNFGDGGFSSQQHPVHTYSTLGYHDITLVAFKNVCRDTLTLPNAIYVSDLIPGFSYVVNSDCAPAGVAFTDSSRDAVKWHWDFGDGDTSSLQNPLHYYLKSPTDSVTLTVTDANGCTRYVSKPAPAITAASFAVSSEGGCVPFPVSFADSSSNAVAWQWDFGDGSVSNMQFPAHTYTTDGYYDVTLIVTAASGCSDTLTIDSMVQVNTPVADFLADSTAGCAPLLVSFADNSQNASVWFWDLGNGSTSGNQHPSLIYTVPGVYNLSLVVENIFGCRDTMRKDSVVYVLGALPSFTLSDTSGCAPFPVAFTNTTQGAVAWEWHFGDGTEDTVLNPVHIYQSAGSYMISLYAFDSAGCSSIYTYPTILNIGESPLPSFTVDVAAGCSPLTVQLDNTGSQADSLVWLMGDGSILTGSMPSYTYTTPGDYVITLVAYNNEGCTDTLVYADTVHVYAQPIADFSVDRLEGCSPFPVQFVNLSTGLDNPVYDWDFGTGDVSAGSDPAYVYANSGVYTVTLTVTNLNGCADTMVKVDYIDVFDQNPPPVTDLYRVTVNASAEVEINWQQTNVHDLDYYVVYKYDPASAYFDSIAQVYQNNTGINGNVASYKDSVVNCTNESYAYKVQAVDKCGYKQDLSVLGAHETILLTTTAGHQMVTLTWTPYEGCAVGAYEIYRQDNGTGSFMLVGEVDSLTLSYVDSSAICPMLYTYKVHAPGICGNPAFDSWSNEHASTPGSTIDQQFVDIVRSTVVDNEYVLTEWGTPQVLPQTVNRYDVYRSTDEVNYSLIASVPASVHEYSDFNVDIKGQEYYYKIFIRNTCDVTAREGLIGSSVLLKRMEIGPGNLLLWTKYLHWDSGVEFYVIEKMNNAGQWIEVDRVPGTVTQWEEK
ncbi:MAG: PKD domain-containing protein [Bacteroidia bacterium]|nr:PKD domain-containing protein [Bacteroidia bacterium]